MRCFFIFIYLFKDGIINLVINMIVYHGSETNNIKQLALSYSLIYDNDEGVGLYFSTSKKVASEYAGSKGSVYTVKIDDLSSIIDLTTEYKILKFLDNVLHKYNFDIFNSELKSHYSLFLLSNNYGKNGVWSLPDDVIDGLKFEPSFKQQISKLSLIKQDIFKLIQQFDGYLLVDRPNQCCTLILKKDNLAQIIKEEPSYE